MSSCDDSTCGSSGGQSPITRSRIPCLATARTSSAAWERQRGRPSIPCPSYTTPGMSGQSPKRQRGRSEEYSSHEAAADVFLEDESPPSDFDWIGDLSLTDSSCACPEDDESATNQPERKGSPILSRSGRRTPFSPAVTSTPKATRIPTKSQISSKISNISSVCGCPTSTRTALNQPQQQKVKKQLEEVEDYYNLPLEAWQKKPGSPKICPPASKPTGKQSAIPFSTNIYPGTSRRLSFPPTPPKTQLATSTPPRRGTVCPGVSRKQSPKTQSVSPVATRKICPASLKSQSMSPTSTKQQLSRLKSSGTTTMPRNIPKSKYVCFSVSEDTSGDQTTCSCSEEDILKKGLEKLSGDVAGKNVSLGVKKSSVVESKKKGNPLMKNFMEKKTKEKKEKDTEPSSSKQMYSFYTSGDIEALMTDISDTTGATTSEELLCSSRIPPPSTSQSPYRSQIPLPASPKDIFSRSGTVPSPQSQNVTCVCSSQPKSTSCSCSKPQEAKTVCHCSSPLNRGKEAPAYHSPKARPSYLISKPTTPSGDSVASVECPAEEEWRKTEEDLTEMDLELEKATEEEVRKIIDALGPAADQFEVVEALCAAGIPDSVIEREMARMEAQSGMDEQELEDLKFIEQMKQLVDEETEDIDIALLLYRKEMEARRRRGETSTTPTLGMPEARKTYRLKRQLHQMHKQVRPYTIVEGDEPEDIQPDVAAAMMHAEEIGLHLGDAPDQLFSYLFKARAGLGGGSKVDVMPGEAEGLAVPGRMNTMPDDNLMVKPGAEINQPPSTDVYSKNIGSAPVVADQRAEASRRQESSASVASDLGLGIDYFLEASAPSYYTLVQLRGSVPPDWFPGYLEAMPDLPEKVRLTTSPSEVMKRAWYYVQPESFKPKDLKMCVDQLLEESEEEEIERHDSKPVEQKKSKGCCCKK